MDRGGDPAPGDAPPHGLDPAWRVGIGDHPVTRFVPVTVTVRTAADPSTTWAVLADLERWPEWNPACAEVELDPDQVATGTQARMQMRHPRGRLFWTAPRITEVEPGRRLAWVTRAFGLRAVLSMECDRLEDGGTAVTLVTRSRGPMGFAYRLMFPEKTQGLIWSGTLTALATHLRPAEPARDAGQGDGGTGNGPVVE